MLRKSLLLLIICCASLFGGQDLNVKVNMKEGNVVEGKLLKINSEGVEINPGGVVKFRFIPAEKIKSVEIIELNKTVEYPLADGDMPLEVKNYQTDVAAQLRTFPKLLVIGSFGYSSVGGKYYEGLNSGTLFRLGLHYYLPESDPTDGRFILGFTYNHATISANVIYGLEPTFYLNEYGFEFGRTTRMFNGGHYIYALTGFVVVSNKITVPVSPVEYTYSETKYAIRLEGDASICVAKKVSVLVSLGYDIVLGAAENSSTSYGYTPYGYNRPGITFAGGIFNLTLGLTYGF
jgi:hypothetical protein